MRLLYAVTIALAAAAVVLFGAGCSPGSTAPSESPQSSVPPPPSPIPPSPLPGVAAAQSPTTPLPVPAPDVAAVPSTATVDLIMNGDFFTWDEGQFAPRHWTIGHGFRVEDMPFKLEPVDDPQFPGGRAVRQTWTGNDTAMGFQRVFGQTIAGLKPNTSYRLDVVARNESKNLVIISAFEMEGFEPGRVASGTPAERLELNVVRIAPDTELMLHTGSFRTGEVGTVKLGARIEGKDPVLPGSVVWDAWRLMEAP